SRGFARIRYDSSDILFQDCLGDSDGQDKDNFAEGIALDDTAHKATFVRTTMKNCIDTVNSYQNGDGFSAEGGNYDLTFTDCTASGCTDAGFDLKAKNVRLAKCSAADNKRNYRIWGTATLTDCVGSDPRKRGGRGSQCQIYI